VLHRHVQIAQDAGLASHQLEKLRREPGRIQVQESDPRNGGLGHQRLEQFRETDAITPIPSVVCEVLRDEVHLARALKLEQLRLPNDVGQRERPMPAAHQWDGAEGAAVVAALADLQVANVGKVTRIDAHSRVIRERVPEEASLGQLRDEPIGFRGSQKEVDLGKGGGQLVLVSLHQASNRDQRLACAVGLEPSRLHNGVDRLVFRGIDETAGIHDDDVGRPEVARFFRPVRQELCKVSLAVDRVLVAAEGDEADFHGRGPGGCMPGKVVRRRPPC
jgi:hypothetical protein